MDWANESYVRIYTRDTTTWKRLGWDGQCVLAMVLRKVDLAGVLDIEDMEPWEAVALHCGAPEDSARRGIAACLDREVLVHIGSAIVAPKFREAQEAKKSDRQRQSESRERRRVGAMSQPVTAGHAVSHAVTNRDTDEIDSPDVTNRDDGSPNAVTDRDEKSHAVTPRHTVSPNAVLTSAMRGSAATPPDFEASVRGMGEDFRELTGRDDFRSYPFASDELEFLRMQLARWGSRDAFAERVRNVMAADGKFACRRPVHAWNDLLKQPAAAPQPAAAAAPYHKAFDFSGIPQ